MADLKLTVQPRTVLGKKVARLRRAGVTPANIYGHNVASEAIQADSDDLGRLLRRAGRTGLVTLTVAGEAESRAVLVRDVQRKPTNDQLLHVDFLQVSMLEKLKVNVPLVLTGHAPVLDTADCVLIQHLDIVEVACLPGDIPQHIDVDVSGLSDIAAAIHVRDIAAMANVEILNEPDTVVVGVSARVAAAEEEEEGAAPAPVAEEVPTVRAGGEQQAE